MNQICSCIEELAQQEDFSRQEAKIRAEFEDHFPNHQQKTCLLIGAHKAVLEP
jgi:hypothetical protein